MYDLNKCKEFLKENNFEVNENDEVKTNTFYFDKKVEYWVSLKEVVKKLNNGSYNLNHHEAIIYNLLLNNDEKLQDDKDFRELIENNLKKIGFSKVECFSLRNCIADTLYGYDIYLGGLDCYPKEPIFVSLGGKVESKLINLEQLDKNMFYGKDCDLFVEIYNKLVKLYKIENHVEEVKEAVE